MPPATPPAESPAGSTPVSGTTAHGRRRFGLVRYFAATSLICMLVIAAALGWIYQHLALRELARQAETNNAALAQTLANALGQRLQPLLTVPETEPAALLRQIEAAGLRDTVVALLRGTQVIKVKLYDRAGRTVFSTEPEQVGAPATDNPGVRAALAGDVRSDLTHRNTFDSFEGTLQDLDVLATYRPAFSGDGSISGVFEIYTDVSPLVAATHEIRTLIAAATLGLLAVLYALLHLLVARAQRILDRQADELTGTIDAIEQANRQLDRRVGERTTELIEANAALQKEISDRLAAEGKLRLAAQVFENSVEGITITDPDTRILAVNRAFTVVTGYSEQEVLGKTPRLLQSGRQSTGFYAAMWETLRSKGHWQGEIWNRRRNGEVFPEWLSISAVKDSSGHVSNYVGVFSDITSLKDTENRLDYLAHHDLLTGLPNRLYFNQRVMLAIDNALRHERRFALIILDLDHFKNINDSLGHDTGDAFLRVIAARLRERMRTGDTLARLGGDEFIALIENIGEAADAELVARQMLDSLAGQIAAKGHELFISASIGISVFPADGGDVHSLVKHAEAAMYKAKSAGRNAWQFYTPDMSADASDRLQTEMQLRRALDNGEITLCYQPQVDLHSGRLVGAEALVRWQHPERGLVPPPKFIPITEETGLINDLGSWALREACAQIARWDRAGFAIPRLAINVSVRQLDRPGFAELIAGICAESGVWPQRLEIEITESVLMQTENATELLARLRMMGLSLSIDDFGTGYSSLSYLRRLPIDKLKIDQAFVTDVTTNANDAAIIESVIALARTMSLATVAEGVESEEQAALLRRFGCHAAQGYHFSRPLPAGEFADWAKSRNA
jgi:diguanylate cyclase (GGDEF)-like protein/PAS domain S-box-containing protein